MSVQIQAEDPKVYEIELSKRYIVALSCPPDTPRDAALHLYETVYTMLHDWLKGNEPLFVAILTDGVKLELMKVDSNATDH